MHFTGVDCDKSYDELTFADIQEHRTKVVAQAKLGALQDFLKVVQAAPAHTVHDVVDVVDDEVLHGVVVATHHH